MTHIPPAEPGLPEERYHHGDLRHALVAAALDLLTEEQNWSFSLREVARRAGVSHNAPYNHFRSKQELLAAVAAAGFDRLRSQMLHAAADAKTPAAALKAMGVAYVSFGTASPAHYRLMFGTTLTSADACPPPAVAEAAGAAKKLLFDVIRQGLEDAAEEEAMEEDAVETAVLSAWSLVHGLTLLLIDGLAADGLMPPSRVSAPAAAQVAEQVAQTLLDGLRLRMSPKSLP